MSECELPIELKRILTVRLTSLLFTHIETGQPGRPHLKKDRLVFTNSGKGEYILTMYNTSLYTIYYDMKQP